MKIIPLTKGYVALVDDWNYEFLIQFRWYVAIRKHAIYAVTWFQKQTILMHRLLTVTPKGMEVDHRNHNGLDNQEHNLRICTTTQNQANRIARRNPTRSGLKGVYWDARVKKWVAATTRNYKWVFIGSFEDKFDAARAYDSKAIEMFGDFALTNAAMGRLAAC